MPTSTTRVNEEGLDPSLFQLSRATGLNPDATDVPANAGLISGARAASEGQGATVPTANLPPITSETNPLSVPQASRPDFMDPSLTPTPRAEVDPRATVRGQMAGLTAEGSPYLEQSRTQAKQRAAARGLLNTTMAAQAGEAAALQAALPIATQDASTYAQYGLQNLQAETNTLLQRLSSSTTLSAADLQAATTILGKQMDLDNKVALQHMVETNKRALQSDASISTAFSNVMTSIAAAYQNPDMNEAEKSAAAEYFMSSFKSYVEFQDVTGGSNYADQFDWGKWDTDDGEGGSNAAAAAARKTDAQKYFPFDTAGSHGEVRTRTSGRGGPYTRYRYDSRAEKWVGIREED